MTKEVQNNKLKVYRFERLLMSHTANLVWSVLNNDQFHRFQIYFNRATESSIYGYKRKELPGTDALIPVALKAIEQAVNLINKKSLF